ncbi:MAG: hypothetical protein ACE5FJ_01050 [Gemmatimonadales bacterium]
MQKNPVVMWTGAFVLGIALVFMGEGEGMLAGAGVLTVALCLVAFGVLAFRARRKKNP